MLLYLTNRCNPVSFSSFLAFFKELFFLAKFFIFATYFVLVLLLPKFLSHNFMIFFLSTLFNFSFPESQIHLFSIFIPNNSFLYTVYLSKYKILSHSNSLFFLYIHSLSYQLALFFALCLHQFFFSYFLLCKSSLSILSLRSCLSSSFIFPSFSFPPFI